MKIAFYVLLGWFILVLQSTVVRYISAGLPQPDLLFVILVWLGLTLPWSTGLVMALSYGFMQDLFVGGVNGAYLFQFTTLYCVMRLMAGRLLLSIRLVQVGVVLIFTLGGDLLLSLTARLFQVPEAAVGAAQIGTLFRGMLNAGAALLVFPALSRIELGLWPRAGRLPLDLR